MRIYVEAKRIKPAFSFLIDDEDFALVSKYKWFLDNYGYPITNTRVGGTKTVQLLHVLLLGKKKGFEIDHINRNPLDNRRSNLRHVTHYENMLNRKRGLGVDYHVSRKSWRARVKFKGQAIHLGWFDTKAEALKVRAEHAVRIYGKYAFV